jgi:NADH kinase
MIVRGLPRVGGVWKRGFSSSAVRREIIDIESLPDRIVPRYPGKFFR